MEKLIEQQNLAKNNFKILTSKSEDNSSLDMNFDHITYLLQQNDEILDHINISKRLRRGIFNGLGTVIKSITGNADNEDIERLTREIEQNRHTIKEQISLTSNILDDFQNQITNLSNNQMELYNITKLIVGKTNAFYLYAQLVYHVETLNNLLERVSNAITFAQHGMFHYSIIKHNTLLESLRYVPKNQLITNNLLMLTAYLKVQLHKLDNDYYFIISLPLVEENTYEYLDITPIIQPYENSLCTFPVSRHRQLLRRDKVFEAVNCIKSEEYICTKRFTKLPLCEQNILKFEEESCNLTTVHCPNNHWTEISNNLYLIYASSIENIEVDCKDGVKQTPVKGSILIRNKGCRIKFGEHIMDAIETPEEILRIPELKIPRMEQVKPIYINNDDKHMHQQIQQLRDLQEIRESPHLIISSNIILMIIMLIIALIVVLGLKYYKKKICRNREKYDAVPTVNIEMTTRETTPASISSISPQLEGIFPVSGKRS